MATHIRVAEPTDLPVLPEVEAASDTVFADAGFPPLPPPGAADELAAAWTVLVAGEPPLGFVRVEIVDGTAHLEQLAVHPSHMRHGIGSALARAAMEASATAGFERMTLCTFAEIAWNGPFYRRLGFRELTELTPELAALREHERATGLDAMSRRTVMVAALTVTDAVL